MEIQMDLPENLFDVLKCALCENYLSVPPINLISEDGNQYKCGRCSSIKTVISTRSVIYEHLAKLMVFPCVYKGCGKKLAFGDVKEHEKVCEQRTITCPKGQCLESFKVHKLAEHFKERHNDAYHTTAFNIKNVYAYYNIDLLDRHGRTFISFFDFDDVNFGITVCALDPTDSNSQYEIKLKSDKSSYMITIGGQQVIAFNEREHCFKCASGHCKFKHHVYRDNRKEISRKMTTKINRDSLKKLFGPGLVTYTITIDEKDSNEKAVKDESKVEVKDALIRKAKKIFLQLLECPFCKEYMSPPIYQCIAGHTVCANCKAKNVKCETCSESIEKTRNFTLEELSKKVELPPSDDKKNIKSDAVKRNLDEPDTTETPSKVVKK